MATACGRRNIIPKRRPSLRKRPKNIPSIAAPALRKTFWAAPIWFAVIQIGAAQKVFRKAGAAMLGMFFGRFLKLGLRFGIIFRLPQAVAIDIGVFARVAAHRHDDG